MSARRVITDEGDFPIQPSHIKGEGHYWGAFGNEGTEVSARIVVRFCQEQGSWKPFMEEQLNEFYHKFRPEAESFPFNNLRDYRNPSAGWIVKDDDGLLKVTDDFIIRCFQAAPAA